jgi:formamidopyrimidine-DNA glycosylase
MPELPEVEVMTRNLALWTAGGRLRRLEVVDPRVLQAGAPESVAGVPFGTPRRHAKLCVLPLGERHALVLHFRMTGKIVVESAGRARPRLRLHRHEGPPIVFEDGRCLGQAWLLHVGELPAFVAKHAPAPEPWPQARSGPWLAACLAGKRAGIKAALMDGRRVAGVGNIGASEACWRAAVDPTTPVPALEPVQWTALMAGIRGWIDDTLAAETGDEIVYLQHGGRNPFQVYGRAGEPCPRCGAGIERLAQAGRSTFWCAGCQGPSVSRPRLGPGAAPGS